MIPVDLKPEPEDFDDTVRKPGSDWLAANGVSAKSPLPRGKTLPPYWTRALAELGAAYSHVCSYFAVRIDAVTGDLTTDHFVPKSKEPGGAYEWTNYRLACLPANRRKHDYDDVLDPVGLRPNTFLLNLSDGSIRPNPSLDSLLMGRARKTIRRLKLNDPRLCRRRAADYSGFLRYEADDHAQSYLMRVSPFVWGEAARQGLL